MPSRSGSFVLDLGIPVEEAKGPVPPPRPAIPPRSGSVTTSTSELTEDLPDHGRATQSLVHTQDVAKDFFDVVGRPTGDVVGVRPTVPLDDFCERDQEFLKYKHELWTKQGRGPDAFDVLAHVFNFQEDSVKNQRDNAVSMLASRLSRAVGRGGVAEQVCEADALLVLEQYHDELHHNYRRWCRFLISEPFSLKPLFRNHRTQNVEKYARAMECALTLLIWGEAGNLRFCPEFLCFNFHKLAPLLKPRVIDAKRTDQVKIPMYLDDIIIPAYELLRGELQSNDGQGQAQASVATDTYCCQKSKKKKVETIDHTEVRNFDDFNEIFWRTSCLSLDIVTMFPDNEGGRKRGALEKMFVKTFMERQTWLVPVFSFWRVHTLHVVGLHAMIVVAKCELSKDESYDYFSDDVCDNDLLLAPVMTLYVMSVVRDAWDVYTSLYVSGGRRGAFGQLLLNILRTGLKGLMTFVLVVLFLSTPSSYVTAAVGFLFIALFLEAIMLTELWWGVSWSCGNRNEGGGFALCLSSHLRQLSWAIIGSLCGINSVNLYTQIHALPPLRKRLRYILFWVIVLGTKIAFSYLVVIKKLTLATYVLYNSDGTEYDFGLFSFVDSRNIIYVAALWIGSGLIYFLDMQIWFVIWANIAAAVEGIRRRVGELSDSEKVRRAFSQLHLIFFRYQKHDMLESTQHTRFAHIWNEIVEAMREEDIISNSEREQLRYFLISLRMPDLSVGGEGTFNPKAEAREWGPLFTLLPEFLLSGAVQRAVQSAQDFGKTIKDIIEEIKREENLAKPEEAERNGITREMRRDRANRLKRSLAGKQAKFLRTSGDDEVTTEMVRQLSATTMMIINALCRNDELSHSLWTLHRALFASDTNRPGGGLKKRKVGIIKMQQDQLAMTVIVSFSKGAVLFNVQEFPVFIGAMSKLVKALNGDETAEGWDNMDSGSLSAAAKDDWSKNVAEKLEPAIAALVAVLKTGGQEAPNDPQAMAQKAKRFLAMVQTTRVHLERWLEDFKLQGKTAPRVWRLLKTNLHSREFLKRTQVFLDAPANSQPGLIKGSEATRRINFFVNSMFVEHPEPTQVLQMPSLTTLTPYYKEEVVYSIDYLKQPTMDGLSVLEYMRSIYDSEFGNFVERMREESREKERENQNNAFILTVDVVDHVLDVLLDTDLDADNSRKNVVKRVERAIVTAVKKGREDDGEDPLNSEELVRVEEAVSQADVDDMVLQLQLWASYRGQTLSRTVRGIMYYSKAVRLLAAVENLEEFQPKENLSIFGSNEKPKQQGASLNPGRGGGWSGVVNEVVQNDHQNKRVTAFFNRFTASKSGLDEEALERDLEDGRSVLESDSDDDDSSVTALVPGQAQQFSPSVAGAGHSPASTSPASIHPAPPLPPRNSPAADTALMGESSPSQDIIDARAFLEFDEENSPRRATVESRSGGMSSAAVSVVFASGRDPPTGGKFKAAAKRALEASRRDREFASKRGRGLLKHRLSSASEKALGSTECKEFIQVKHPVMNTMCNEYGLTEGVAEAKYRYVVSCQVFGAMQKSKKPEEKEKARQIEMLAKMYSGLRIAYVEEEKGRFYSVLTKYNGKKMEQEYRIMLPGHILVGEGKPNNQNHAIIFTRGEAIQAIDMNQDASLEDAVKIRQVMQEFKFAEGGTKRGHNLGRIVGFREHVFTHDVSSVANFFSLQELNFVAATQRALDNPLHVRFHYGHPDLFDRMSAITLGGVSKACKGIHLSEDIFAGFNYVLRGGESTQADYIQVAKGRDTGVAQVTGFTAKISMGNGMQCRSREVSRLASQFDLFRLLSFYFSSVGGFMNQVLLMVAVFLYVYAKLYIVFDPDFSETVDDDVLDALSSQFLFQLGFLLILPIPLLLAVEQSFQRAISTLFNILVRLAPFFFIFSAGTNAHYVNTAIQTGQAEYKATGRGFVIQHEEFVEMYRQFLVSHFQPAFELLVVLIVYANFASDGYFLETFSVFLLAGGLLWTPVMFNPNALDFTYASKDFGDWLEWMNSPVDDPKKSWMAWYNATCEHARKEWPLDVKIQTVLYLCRLLVLVYGFLTAVEEYSDKYWPGTVTVAAVLFVLVWAVMFPSWLTALWCKDSERKLDQQQQQAEEEASGLWLSYPGMQGRWTRLWNILWFVTVILGIIILASVGVVATLSQVIYFILAFVILVYFCAQVVTLFSKKAVRRITMVRIAFKSVHLAIGFVIMVPVLLISFFPLFVELQTRLLFNEDFAQRFNIAKIFSRQRNRRRSEKKQA